jgi:magnesium and cobalt transporter
MKEDPLSRPPDPGADFSSSHQEKKALPFFVGMLRGMLGAKAPGSLEDGVADLLQEYDPQGMQVGAEERYILHNIFRLSDMTLEDIMTPRADIVAVASDAGLPGLAEIALENEHTRIPVYEETLDNVVGFVHTKDLVRSLYRGEPFDMQALTRPILFAPPSMKILDMLMKMRAEHVHMAIVLDEYGGADGLVTLEDVIEEIIGKIEDEHDGKEDEPEWIECGGGDYVISARMPAEELERKFGVRFPESGEEYDTVGGLLAYMLGRVPRTGETVDHPTGLRFTVREADLRRVKKVRVGKAA